MKQLGLVTVFLFGAVLFYVAADFPDWGDPQQATSTHLSPHYIEKTMEETSVPNIVSAVLADYRGYDTMFETAVVFTAALACFFLLRVFVAGDPKTQENLYYHIRTGVIIRCRDGLTIPETSVAFHRLESLTAHYDLITSTMSRLISPFIQIYALYVIAHGHHSPGGGFQGGVILGASYILLAVSYDLHTVSDRFSEKNLMRFLALGVLLYAGVGATCFLYGGNFLDYSALAPLLHVDPIAARSLGILFVEVGVAMTVMATMVLIYGYISSVGKYERGL